MNWQLIETAPKDGTEILVVGILCGEIFGKKDDVTIGKCSWNGEEWLCTDADYYVPWYENVTHWMPLPPLPIE
jgi:Protein of unknown function (DUF551)